MAFVDVTQSSLYGNGGFVAGGAPSGGGNIRAAGTVGVVAPGSKGMGTDAQIRHWVFGFYLLIGVVLVSAGVIFNGKG